MKRCIYFLLFSLSLFTILGHLQAQKQVSARTYNIFVKEYQTSKEKRPGKEVVMRHDTMVHPLAIASNYFVQQKVYPNEDAIRLIQELNPKIDMADESKIVNGDTRLILPNYPPPNENVLMQFKTEYLVQASIDQELNLKFKNSSELFNQIFQKLTIPEDVNEKRYYDSLAFFNNKILPYINNSAGSISRLQMRYFFTELSALNNTFQQKVSKPAVMLAKRPGNNHTTASYIIADFFEIANPIYVKRSIYSTRHSGGNSSEVNNDYEFILFNNLTALPFACNLYVYGKDEQGNRKQDPEMFAYDVWVGDKMSFMTRKNGSTPESYGFVKMGNPASTLPFNIGFGKWIVVLKKQGGNEEFFKEISIFSETEFEPNNPDARKVCYIIN